MIFSFQVMGKILLKSFVEKSLITSSKSTQSLWNVFNLWNLIFMSSAKAVKLWCSEPTCFPLKMEIFVKSGQVRRTSEFLVILHTWPMKCYVTSTACISSLRDELCWIWPYELIVLWTLIVGVYLMQRWLVVYVYMWQLYVAWIMDVVGDCTYVKWWWIVVDCICTSIGDVEVNCLCEHMHCSWVICSCIHDWWWWILYPIEVITMFLLHRRWRPWGDMVPHASRWV